ncbi:hypothetical protein BJY01DRAFT_245438 [Aspergillus pseudoustus]|uniref:Uncharacterized protein n=1 Tax=Aspergillus pseudoustus TaxID=1810923 RepID=A0ABR4KEA1_9EURO
MKFTMVISLLTLILPAVAVLDGPIPNHIDHDTDNNNRFPYVSDHDKFYDNTHVKRTDENGHIGPISHPIVDDDDDNRIEGYNITEFKWEIEVHPETGKTIVAQGTIEQIRDEALKHNPDWDAHYMEPAEQKIKRALEPGSFAEIGVKPGGTGSESELEAESSSPPHLAKRKFNLLRRLCGGPWKPTYWDTALRSAAKVTLMKGFS